MINPNEVIKEIIDILSDPSVFSSGVLVVNYSGDSQGNVTGRFKDIWSNRLFEFSINNTGVAYKPVASLDNFTDATKAGKRLDSYSAGMSSVAEVLDSAAKKRIKKPQCTASNYNCGFTCIDIRKACGVAPNESITLERIAKLKKMVLATQKDNKKSSTLQALVTETVFKYKEKINEGWSTKEGREARSKFASLTDTELMIKEERLGKELYLKRQEEKAVELKKRQAHTEAVKKRTEGYAKIIKDMNIADSQEYFKRMRTQLESGEDVAAFLGLFHDRIEKDGSNLAVDHNERTNKQLTIVLATKGESEAYSFLLERNKKNEEFLTQYHDNTIKSARELIYVESPSKMQSEIKEPQISQQNGGKSSELEINRVEVLKRGIEEFKQLVGVSTLDEKTLKVVSTERGRSFYRDRSNTISMANDTSIPVVIHESGHWLEESDLGINKKARDFLERRTAGEQWQKLSALTGNANYADTEIAKPDKFLHPYMGKKVNSASNSEIISMGLEYMYRDPARFAKKDPEYFAFIHDTMRGK